MSDKADATHHKYFKINLPDGEGAIFCLPLLFLRYRRNILRTLVLLQIETCLTCAKF